MKGSPRHVLLALPLLLAAAPPQPPRDDAPACTRYQGARFRVDDTRTAVGITVCGHRVKEVHATALPPARPGIRVVDLGGGTVVPGLHDAHAHLDGVGAFLKVADLSAARSARDVADTVAAFARAHPGLPWVRGRGWDQEKWPCTGKDGDAPCGGAMPDRALLDAAVPDRPVMLRRVDGHAAWVNTRALDLARAAGAGALADGAADPAGGRVLRDAAGRATGVLVDSAMELVDAAMPPPDDARLEDDLRVGAEAARAAGLTAVHQMSLSLRQLALLRKLDAEGRLAVRVFVYLDGTEKGAVEALPRNGPGPLQGRVMVRGVKLFADGSLGSRGAVLLAPYADEHAHSGTWVTDRGRLAEIASAVHARKHQVAVHAIGDAGVRGVLDVLVPLRGKNVRHRVEHAQVVSPEDMPRFAAGGVVASMQPTHATSDMPWAETRLGPERVRGAYAWRSLRSAGAVLALGSDAPVESIRPLLGLYAARTRMDQAGKPAGGWRAEEALDGAAALHGFTAGAAWAAQQEKELGTLAVGRRADFTWLDTDPVDAPAAALLSARVLGVAVDGDLWRAPP